MDKTTATALTVAAAAAATLLAVGPADAATSGNTWTQSATRHAAGIPSPVAYDQGSAVVVAPGLRCFTATVAHRARIGSAVVHRGDVVGYCGDGYVDVADYELGVRVIFPAR
jgi:hypothetical protein